MLGLAGDIIGRCVCDDENNCKCIKFRYLKVVAKYVVNMYTNGIVMNLKESDFLPMETNGLLKHPHHFPLKGNCDEKQNFVEDPLPQGCFVLHDKCLISM